MTDIRRNFFRLVAAALVFVATTTVVLGSFSKDAQALQDVGPGRIRSCNANGTPEGLSAFLPAPGDNSRDILFDLSNPVCLTIAITSYVAVKAAILNMNGICGSGSVIPRVVPSPILDLVDYVKAVVTAVRDRNPACGVAAVAAIGALGVWVGELRLVYEIADFVNDNSRICGSNWMKPSPTEYTFSTPGYKQHVVDEVQRLMREDPSKLNINSGSMEYREWYYQGVEVIDNPENFSEICLDPTVSLRNYPRQKYYMRGTERGNFNCDKYKVFPGDNDPKTGAPYTPSRQADMRKAYDCCKKRSQNYICVEYDGIGVVNTVGEAVENAAQVAAENIENAALIAAEEAAQAGLQAAEFSAGIGGSSAGTSGISTNISSPNISNNLPALISKRKFCRVGQMCTIGGIVFSTASYDNDRLICAKTYSVCPYNFTIGLGTDKCDYYQDGIWNESGGFWRRITPEEITTGKCAEKSEIRNSDCTFNDKAGKCRNYCQYLTHCVRNGTAAVDHKNGLNSPYFSTACKNFIGDSQNRVSYGAGAFGGSLKHFSAPIAQCVKETLANVFYNRVGHSECEGSNELPSADGTCASGRYSTQGSFFFRVGERVSDKSFFVTLQDKMQLAVKLAMTLSMMFYGMNILMGKADLRSKKDILSYIIKFAIIGYFAMGDAWQSQFFDGVYGASSEMSRMVFKMTAEEDIHKRDGCQFLDFELQDGTYIDNGFYYPEGKNYIALWDTLDCKIMRYLGFGPEASIANIALLITAAFFTGAVGFYIAVSAMCFGFFFISATVRALHIFLSSSLAIVLFVFISPLVFPLMLFTKTKGIFDGWLTNLISFTLQPMILFAYISVFCTVMDRAFIGSAGFHGNPPTKALSCSAFCVDSNGLRNDSTTCTGHGDTWVNPMNDSMACLVNFDQFGSFPGFEMFGIGLPFLFEFFDEGNKKQKIMVFLRAALVMYLLYKFMDEIPGITKDLIGGEAVPSSKSNPLELFTKVTGVARGAQERGAGMVRNLAKGAWGGAKRTANYASTGKETGTKSAGSAKPGGPKADHAASSGGSGGGDKAGSSGGGGSDKGAISGGDKK